MSEDGDYVLEENKKLLVELKRLRQRNVELMKALNMAAEELEAAAEHARLTAKGEELA